MLLDINKMEPIIKIKNLSVTYGQDTGAEVKALEKINLEILPEEFVIIFGPSGCGKSTLLYAISGAERRISSGELWIKNQNLREMEGDELTAFHRKSVGMVFQAHNLINTVSVFENVTLPLVFRGVSKKERDEIGKNLLEDFGLYQFANKLPNLLSGGQQQRVGICRALVSDTDVILADEPTGNLDSQSAIYSMNIFADINTRRNKTIIMVTHEAQYLPYASRVVYMKDGQITGEVRQNKGRINQTELQEKINHNQKTSTKFVTKLAGYFGLNLSNEEEMRFKNFVENFTERKINKEEIRIILDKSFKDGGLGLHTRIAKKVTDELDQILAILDSILAESKDKNLKEEKENIYKWLFADYAGKLSEKQETVAMEAIVKRIEGSIGGNEFLEILDRPLDEGGAGFNWRTARNITQKLDLIV